MRMYHPHTGAEITTVSDDPDHIAVHTDAGWLPAPEPEAIPGHEPDPVIYAPVEAEKPRRRRNKPDETVPDVESTGDDETDS